MSKKMRWGGTVRAATDLAIAGDTCHCGEPAIVAVTWRYPAADGPRYDPTGKWTVTAAGLERRLFYCKEHWALVMVEEEKLAATSRLND